MIVGSARNVELLTASAAREVVSRPETFADQPELRENAWRTLVEARGGTFAPRNIPVMTHAEPGRPARGVAAELAKSMTHGDKTSQIHRSSLESRLAQAAPNVTAAVTRYFSRAEDPTGGSAA